MSLQTEILEYLEDGKLATIAEICQHCKVNRNWVQSALRGMAEQEVIVRHDRQVGTRPRLKYSVPEKAVVEVA